MTYSESIQYLYDLRMFGAKLGLENVRKLAAKVGNPQESSRFIHIAGTNGKGSTCAFLESIYRHAGYRTGLFSSPHLVSFRERMQVNRELISEGSVVALVEELQGVLSDFPRDSHPTFFEVLTVMAFMYYRNEDCDVVILETGLGGRLDATNIVTPLASGITNIDLDHQAWLGETKVEIAKEKAGIIKEGVPSFTCETETDVLEVIAQKAQQVNSSLCCLGSDQFEETKRQLKSLPLLGEHQWKNASLARVIAESQRTTLPVTDHQLRQGLVSAHLSGRFQMVEQGSRQIILDCAHNPAGVRTFVETLAVQFPGEKISLIIGMLGDKETQTMCCDLAKVAKKILVLPVQSSRSASPESLRETFGSLAPDIPVEIAEGIEGAFLHYEDEALVAITGSIHFLGEVIQSMGMDHGPNERALNEYGDRTSMQAE